MAIYSDYNITVTCLYGDVTISKRSLTLEDLYTLPHEITTIYYVNIFKFNRPKNLKKMLETLIEDTLPCPDSSLESAPEQDNLWKNHFFDLLAEDK